MLTSTESQIRGYWISAYKGVAQGETWDDLLRRAEELGANTVLNTYFDNALDLETSFHGSAVVLKREARPRRVLRRPKRIRPPLRSSK
jgi:uncharacterized protein YbjQ (UPF0145 family)